MLISICIPTYNSGEKLERLLNSIRIQTYKNFEIIISDDSNNDGVKEIIYSKYSNLNIKYYKNEIALGTPNNWNNAVAKSNGEWVNLMHHDDWYTSENSLQQFANAAMNHQNKLLIFSAYYHYHLEDDTKVLYHTSKLEILMLKQKYLTLYKSIMGNPSTTLINSRYKPFYYDTNFKWLIDYDFFTTLFENEHSFHYIPSALVNLGMHKEQVTAYVFQNPEYEIPESIGLLKKHGIDILKNFFIFKFLYILQ